MWKSGGRTASSNVPVQSSILSGDTLFSQQLQVLYAYAYFGIAGNTDSKVSEMKKASQLYYIYIYTYIIYY